MKLDGHKMHDQQPHIALRQFGATFPSFTLAPISLEIGAGERVAFVGPNGSGKTTTFRALAGRFAEYDGAILFDGRDARGLLPLLRRQIGFLPETLAGYGWMTVRDHLAFLREFYPDWDVAYERHLVDRLRVPLDQALGRLSKGTRVKVSFVAAESYRPPILLLDEPTSGLDPEARGELLDAVLASQKERRGRIVLFSTHLLEDVEFMAERVLLLVDGCLRLDAPLTALQRASPGVRLSAILHDAIANPSGQKNECSPAR